MPCITPTTCPHGNSLLAEVDTPALQPLSRLAIGQTATIARIADESTPLLTYLGELGVYPGVAVTVTAIAPFDGPLMITISQAQYAVSREVAEHILMQ